LGELAGLLRGELEGLLGELAGLLRGELEGLLGELAGLLRGELEGLLGELAGLLRGELEGLLGELEGLLRGELLEGSSKKRGGKSRERALGLRGYLTPPGILTVEASGRKEMSLESILGERRGEGGSPSL